LKQVVILSNCKHTEAVSHASTPHFATAHRFNIVHSGISRSLTGTATNTASAIARQYDDDFTTIRHAAISRRDWISRQRAIYILTHTNTGPGYHTLHNKRDFFIINGSCKSKITTSSRH
jgi:hypothetical protein